jgi:hypothetical protein
MTHKLTFTYETDTFETMSTTSSNGSLVSVMFENASPAYVDIDGHEFDASDDVLNILSVSFTKSSLENEYVAVLDIVRQAAKQIDGIRDEYLAEQREELAMERELSSPYMTGRI